MYIYTYTYARQNKKYTTVRKSPRSRYLSIHSFKRHNSIVEGMYGRVTGCGGFAYLSIHSFNNTHQYANPAHPLLLVYICILVYAFLQKHTTVRKSRTSLVTCLYLHTCLYIPSKTHNSTQIPHIPCYLSIHSFNNLFLKKPKSRFPKLV